MGKLTVKGIESLGKGRHADGDGLYLQVTAAGSRSWLYRYSSAGRAHEMGLGAYPAVSLATAREKARDATKARAGGIDPLTHKRTSTAAASRAAVTFAEIADEYLSAHKSGWSPKTNYIWELGLRTYAGKAFGSLPVAEIGVDHLLKLLRPIWAEKAETASRVRRQVEAVLNYARSRGLRSGDNPAAWKGNLQFALVSHAKIVEVDHYAALHYSAAPAFIKELREREGLGVLGFEFLILTAARTGEVLGASWDEIDFESAVWSIPAERMKASKPHRVPLSERAVAILRTANDYRRGSEPWIWPGDRIGRPLSNMAFLTVLRRMKRNKVVTAHGFRATFKTWATETTDYPRELVEMSLAHTVGNEVERAYLHGDVLKKRRALMEAWAKYLG